MAGEASVEQRLVKGGTVPCAGVTAVAPSVEAERLLKASAHVGDDVPAAEIVGVDVM